MSSDIYWWWLSTVSRTPGHFSTCLVACDQVADFATHPASDTSALRALSGNGFFGNSKRMASLGCHRRFGVLWHRSDLRNLILPSDQFRPMHLSAFLKVVNPKIKRRGKGRIQHLKLTDRAAIHLLERAVGHLDPSLALFPAAPAAFRKRWDGLLVELQIPELSDLPLHPSEVVG